MKQNLGVEINLVKWMFKPTKLTVGKSLAGHDFHFDLQANRLDQRPFLLKTALYSERNKEKKNKRRENGLFRVFILLFYSLQLQVLSEKTIHTTKFYPGTAKLCVGRIPTPDWPQMQRHDMKRKLDANLRQ